MTTSTSETPDANRSMVAICSHNRPEWCITELCCIADRHVVVPIAATAAPDHASYIINKTQLGTVVVSARCLAIITGVLHRCASVHTVVCMDTRELAVALLGRAYATTGDAAGAHARAQGDVDALIAAGKLHFFPDVEVLGAASPAVAEAARAFVGSGSDGTTWFALEAAAAGASGVDNVFEARADGRHNEAFSIVFTSGSTGNPKGAVFTYDSWLHQLEVCMHILCVCCVWCACVRVNRGFPLPAQCRWLLVAHASPSYC